MAKKVILKDQNDIEVLPITRGELVLDSSGQQAFHSSQFLATQSQPGLMSGEDKTKLDSLEKVTVEDKKVEQVNTTTNNSYRILFSNSADDTTKTEGARKSAKLLFNPSTGALTATALIGKLDWSNLNNIPEEFTPTQHIHNTSEITALTSYSKASSASDLVTTDTLNAALGKLEYKADTAYTFYKSITGTDNDEIINKWEEIVDFVDSVKEGSDITDMFVTRETDQTITGVKTFAQCITIQSGQDTKLVLNNTDTESKYQFISFRQNGTQYGYLGTLGDDVLKWSNNTILHSGNSYIHNGVITINGATITPITSHQSLANYVTLNGNQTISGVKTFSTQQKFTVAQGTAPFTVTSTTKVSNLNSDMVDGYHISTAGTTKPWSTIVTIGSDGVSEMGRYIDFHYDNTTGSDYSTRLQCRGNHSNVVTLPSATGTLALTSQIPSVTNYYWANVKVSATSSTTTTPTFANTTVNGILTINGPQNALTINSSAKTAYTQFTKMLNPNMSATYHTSVLSFGYDQTAYNIGYIGFKFVAKDSKSNMVTLGLHSADHILNITGNGSVGIGTTSPEYKLDVNGVIRASSHLITNARVKILDGQALEWNDTAANGSTSNLLLPRKSYGYRLDYYDGTAWHQIAYKTDIPTKTSQLTNDSGYVTGGPYLPLSGGTISGTYGALTIHRTNENSSLIKYSNTSGVLGYLGFYSSKEPFVFKGTDTTTPYKIWHEGNDGHGSGLDADMLDGYHVTHFMSYIKGSGYVQANLLNSELWNVAGGDGYIEYYDNGTWFNSRWGKVLAHYGFDGDLRGNASSATKLQTARTIWGRNFDGSANIWDGIDIDGYKESNSVTKVSDLGTKGLVVSATSTRAHWGMCLWTEGNGRGMIQQQAFTSAATTYPICMQPFGGNVGIGTTAPIHKLQVAGAGVFNNTGSTTYATNGITIGAGDSSVRYITCYGKTGSSFINVGYGPGVNNSGEFFFSYAGNGSTSNYSGVGIYGGANYMYLYPDYTTFRKPLVMPGKLYSGNCAINMSNSDIININALYTADNADNGTEGLQFSRGNGYYDSVWASGGTLYFSPNGNLNRNGSYSTNYKIWHEGNDGTGSGLDADTVDGVHASSLSQIKYIGNTPDFCYDVILLCKRDVAHNARLDGLLFTTGGGVCRYHCADAHFWHSCWSVGSYDTQKSISNKGYDGYGFEFCTCTYGGAVWYAIKLNRIQAVSYFFMGDWDNINWTLITYYHTSQGVKNSEIYNSISNLTSTPLRYSGSIYAHHFYESSDRLLKTNIVDINSSDNIPQLKSFDWKSDGSHSYGLIAQELEAMGYPELVSNNGSYKTVNYSAALSLIVGKLQVKIKELEKEIETLKNKN